MSYNRSDNTDSRWLLVDNLHDAVKNVLPEDLIVGGIEVVTGVWIVGSWRGDFYHRGIFQTELEAQEAAYSHETVSYVPWGIDLPRVFGKEGDGGKGLLWDSDDEVDYSNVGEVSTCEGYGPQSEELLRPDDGGESGLMGLKEI